MVTGRISEDRCVNIPTGVRAITGVEDEAMI